MAFAQNRASMDRFGATPEGVAVLDEIHALGGYGPRVISTRPSPASSTYSPESRVTSDYSQSPPSSNSSECPPSYPSHPESYPPSHAYSTTADVQSTPSFSSTPPSLASSVTGSVPLTSIPTSMPVSFDWEKYEYSLLTPPDNTSCNDFDNIFGTKVDSSNFPPKVRPTVVEGLGLGLGGEWQPVMDHVGL